MPAPAPRWSRRPSRSRSKRRSIGVDNMLYMKSTSGNDGSYTLTVTFAVGTDPDLNTVKVQNRVSLAEPQLPQRGQGAGRQRQEEVVGAAAGRRAVLRRTAATTSSFCRNYATINIIDQLKRITGIGDVVLFTPSDYSMTVWLNTDRMTSFGLTPSDIANAIEAPEHPGRGRPHRRAAGAARPAVPAQHPDQGPPHHRRGVRQHRRARQSGRLVRARAATWRASSSRAQLSESRGRQDGQPGGGDRHLSRRPAATRSTAPTRCKATLDAAQDVVPGRRRLQDHLRHHGVRQRKHQERGAHAGRGVRAGRHRGVPVPRQRARDASFR